MVCTLVAHQVIPVGLSTPCYHISLRATTEVNLCFAYLNVNLKHLHLFLDWPSQCQLSQAAFHSPDTG